MAYDNTKLELAVDRWLTAECIEGFGETYSGTLLTSFEDFCFESGALKRSPGRVAFGSALKRRGFETRKMGGLTFWAGITLKTPPAIIEPRQNPAAAESRTATRVHKIEENQSKLENSAAERAQRAAEVKKRMRDETKERNQRADRVSPE